jgi:hypothetical protein
MCVTRPPTCATQLEMGSNSLLRTCTLPCTSATTTPYDEDVIVEIEVPTRKICGLSARSCTSLTGTTSKNGNCLHCETYQRVVRIGRRDLLLARRWSTLLQSVWKASTSERLDRSLRAGNTALGIGLEIPTPTPNPTADGRGRQLTLVKHPRPLNTPMAFFGLRKWPTPVSEPFVMLITLFVTCPICILDTYPVPVLLAQVFRPLWPFFAASGITYFLVSKAQDIGVRCELMHPSETVRKLSQLTLVPFFLPPL